MNDKVVLIVGGTGTLGQMILPKLIDTSTNVRVLSRGEHKQVELAHKHKDVEFMLGDVADRERVEIACRGCDEVYHFAAIKHVHKAERDVHQAIKTNVLGTLNVINGCIRNNVSKCIFTSTDKAVEPLNVYGASKLLAERAWIAGNQGAHNSRFSAVRYGNVLASSGSVLELWLKQRDKQEALTITDPEMTRFFLTVEEAATFVFQCMQEMEGGEVFIPKVKATSMKMMANMLSDRIKKTGVRPGEKMHEVLISKNEMMQARDAGHCFIRYPDTDWFTFETKGQWLPKDFEYTSLTAQQYTDNELRDLLCTLLQK